MATAQHVLIGLGALAELAGIVLAVLEVRQRREDVKGYRERPRSVSASRAVSWNVEHALDVDRPGDARTVEQRLEALEADQRAHQDVVEAAKQQAVEAAKVHAEAMSTGLQAKADRDVSEVRDLLLRVTDPTWPVWTSLFLLVTGLALQAVASWLGVK